MGSGRQLKPCGTEAAYRRHRRNGEIPCAECKAAEAEARFRRGANSKMTPSRTQPCSRCSEPMWKGKSTAPEGSAMCQPCRRLKRDLQAIEGVICLECGQKFTKSGGNTRCGPCRHKRAKQKAMMAGNLCSTCGKPAVAKNLCITHYARAYVADHGSDHSGRRSSWIARWARLAIYERDNWTCQICQEPVTKTFHWAPDSPTLDHIIPRSLGGDHSVENLRTACWSCNTCRGNRVEPQELEEATIG